MGLRSAQATLLCALMCLALTAAAGGWNTNAGLNSQIFYTDNLFLAPSSGKSDIVLDISPFFAADREGARASARVVYAPTLRLYQDESSFNGVSHSLQANGTVELFEDYFFVTGAATAGEALIDPRSTSTFDPISAPGASTQFATVSLVPSLRFPIGSGRNARMAIEPGISYVYTDETVEGDTSEGVFSWRLSALVASGPDVKDLPWGLTYRRVTFDTDSGDGLWRADSGLSYRFNRTILGTLSLGYAEGDYESTNDTSGPSWRVGFTWTPSPRTTLTAGYGQAFWGDDSLLDLEHRHRRTLWRARYRVAVQDPNGVLLDQEVIPLEDAFGNPIVDPFAAQVPSIVRNTATLNNTIFVRQQATASVGATWGRTAARLELDLAKDTPEQEPNPTTTSSQLLFDLSRRITPKTSASVLFQYWDYSEDSRDSTTAEDADFEQYRVALRLTRSLTRRTAVGISVEHTERTGGADTNSYEENRVSASVSMQLR